MPRAPGRRTALVGSQAAPSGHTEALGWLGGLRGLCGQKCLSLPLPSYLSGPLSHPEEAPSSVTPALVPSQPAS